MLNIVVLASGGGTNLQALIDAQQSDQITNGWIGYVICSNPKAYALERAARAQIPTLVLSPKQYADMPSYTDALLSALQRIQPDLIVLAGFMHILDRKITDAYANRIINVHPSLIPSFCGVGYYGLRVHQQVLEYGVKLTGATVHFVNEKADAGAIILQKAVPVKQNDTPQCLQKRVMVCAERVLLPQAVDLFCQGRIQLVAGKAIVTFP